MNKKEIGLIKSLFKDDSILRLYWESDADYEKMKWERETFEAGLENREKLEIAKMEFQIKMEELNKSKPWWKLW